MLNMITFANGKFNGVKQESLELVAKVFGLPSKMKHNPSWASDQIYLLEAASKQVNKETGEIKLVLDLKQCDKNLAELMLNYQEEHYKNDPERSVHFIGIDTLDDVPEGGWLFNEELK